MRRESAEKALEEGETPNIWNAYGFAMSGLGEKFRILGLAKHLRCCIRWSWQRVTRGYCEKDVWNMDVHLEELLPAMLQYLKDNRHGSPASLGENTVNEEGILVNETCHAEWDRILDRMIFLWHESLESTCSRENPLEEEYTRALHEFTERYGLFGEKLAAEEEQAENRKKGSKRIHFMEELPEYQPLSERYREEENQLWNYRETCREEALDLLKKYFADLCD